MGDKTVDIDWFSDEGEFSVGQKVAVDFPEIPSEERLDTIGTIIGISTRFPATPSLRRITYEVRFPTNYVKPEFRMMRGITTIHVEAKRLTAVPPDGNGRDASNNNSAWWLPDNLKRLCRAILSKVRPAGVGRASHHKS